MNERSPISGHDRRWLFLLTLVVDLVVVVVTLKLIKTVRNYIVFLSADSVAATIVATILIVLIGALLAGRWLTRVRKHSSKLSARVVLSTGVAVILMTEIVSLVILGSLELRVLSGIVLFKWDLAFFFLVVVVLRLLIGRASRLATIAFTSVVGVVVGLYCIDFVYFWSSGSQANWFLLQYSLLHRNLVIPAISSEVSLGSGLLLSLPVVLVLVSHGVSRTSMVRRVGFFVEEALQRRFVLPIGALTVLLITFLPARLIPELSRPVAGNLFLDVLLDSIQTGFVVRQVDKTVNSEIELPLYSAESHLVVRKDANQLNIVLILLESVRANSMPPVTPRMGVTPFLATLASRSLVVKRMYVAMPSTTEALVAIYYGRYPSMSGRVYYPEVATKAFPQMLREVGYRTAFFTSANLVQGRGERAMLSRMGFEEVISSDELDRTGLEHVGYSGIEDRALIEPSLDWIDRQSAAGAPFHLSILTQTTHHDYGTPEYFSKRDYETGDDEFDAYLNALAYTDSVLETLFAGFQERGLFDNSVFVVVGDHGEAFGEHGLRFHINSVHEEVIRVPCYIFVPSVFPDGRQVDGLFQQMDIFPTLVDLVGFDLVGQHVGGVSLLSQPGGRPKLYVSSLAHESMALLTDSLKYIYQFRRTPVRAYQIWNDPYETSDVGANISLAVRQSVELDLLLWRGAVNRSFADIDP